MGASLGGGARGALVERHPAARLMAGSCFVIATVVLDPATASGLAATVLGCIVGLAVVRPPAPALLKVVATGLVMIGPFALFLPWVEAGPLPESAIFSSPALVVGTRILVRGLAVVALAAMTAAAIRPVELNDALGGLPLPSLVTAIIGAIVHQSRLMVAETRRLVDVLTVRGATGRGRAWWRVLKGLPSVWLPRILAKGRRLGDTMEVRGHDGTPRVVSPRRLDGLDVTTISVAGSWLVLAILARWL